jgi:hypothetical protein
MVISSRHDWVAAVRCLIEESRPVNDQAMGLAPERKPVLLYNNQLSPSSLFLSLSSKTVPTWLLTQLILTQCWLKWPPNQWLIDNGQWGSVVKRACLLYRSRPT